MSKTCKIYYLLNEEGRRNSLLGNGDGKEGQCIEVPLTKEILSIETLKINRDGEAKLQIGGSNCEVEAIIKRDTFGIRIDNNSYYKPFIGSNTKHIEFDHVLTAEEAISWEKSRLENLKKSRETLQPQYEKLLNEYNEKLEEYNQKKELEELNKRKKKELDNQIKEKEKKDDIFWIKNYGSERLKLCLELDYECRRLYIQERTAKEFPGFELDFDDYAHWQERVSPSLKALQEAQFWIKKGFECEIVWLTSSVHGSDYDYENDFERCEAIVLQFRGYYLVKRV